ncbi:hypothetical protein NDU88_004192 [Pleurodeles waltl]|uniref:Uncharacterized protein n=1 Tax=Pleurodeles waltl TaxID=8319 RepID=A0AAV7T6S3_PLEWA|nr:hypothetical protein NDU88_004192 [Pleurodeles waltl]
MRRPQGQGLGGQVGSGKARFQTHRGESCRSWQGRAPEARHEAWNPGTGVLRCAHTRIPRTAGCGGYSRGGADPAGVYCRRPGELPRALKAPQSAPSRHCVGEQLEAPLRATTTEDRSKGLSL